MIEYDQANDEINALFLAKWNAESAAIAGYIPAIEWQGVTQRDAPDGSKFWVRVSKQNVFEEQSTLSTCEALPGQKRYTSSGLVFVQLFCPKSYQRSFEIGQTLAKLARDSFRGKSTDGGIWFRNVRINELPPEELYQRFNVIADFEYDEIS
jgi:hypothetical protein